MEIENYSFEKYPNGKYQIAKKYTFNMKINYNFRL